MVQWERAGKVEQRPVRSGSADDAAFLMGNADSVIIVPGYGLAVARAQHAINEMAELFNREGRQSALCHPPCGRTYARAYERIVG